MTATGGAHTQKPEMLGGKKRVGHLSDAAWDALASPQSVEDDAGAAAIRAAVEALPDDLRVVIEGLFYERISTHALGARLGISHVAVMKRRDRAMSALRTGVLPSTQVNGDPSLTPMSLPDADLNRPTPALRGGLSAFYDDSGALLESARDGISVLPADQRVMVQGYLVSQLTDAELAQRTGKSESAVKALKSAGLEALRALLNVKAVFPEATAVESAAS